MPISMAEGSEKLSGLLEDFPSRNENKNETNVTSTIEGRHGQRPNVYLGWRVDAESGSLRILEKRNRSFSPKTRTSTNPRTLSLRKSKSEQCFHSSGNSINKNSSDHESIEIYDEFESSNTPTRLDGASALFSAKKRSEPTMKTVKPPPFETLASRSIFDKTQDTLWDSRDTYSDEEFASEFVKSSITAAFGGWIIRTAGQSLDDSLSSFGEFAESSFVNNMRKEIEIDNDDDVHTTPKRYKTKARTKNAGHSPSQSGSNSGRRQTASRSTARNDAADISKRPKTASRHQNATMEKPPAASTSVPTSSLTAPNSRMQSNDLSFSDAEIVVPPPEPPARVMSNNVSIGGSKEARTSFTADSPYYTSYVEQEMRQLQVLSETLRDISARAKTFGKCGALMAEATRRLALSCRFKASTPGSADEDEETRQDREDKIAMERHEAVGDEMGTVLFTLGGVLDEIADAQVSMCESLEASLSLSLEAFCGTQLQEVSQLKQEAEQMTENAESSMSKYLNGRNAPDMTSTESWNKISEQVSSQVGSTFSKWKAGSDVRTGSDGRMGSAMKSWRGKVDEAGSNIRRGRSKTDVDPALALATTTANLRLTLEQIRLAQASAELKRFQLLKQLISIKKRRNFELGESALASLHGIRAYFHHCSDLVQGLSPQMNRIQKTQKVSREKHTAQQLPWDARELGLRAAINTVGEAVAHANFLAEGIANGELPAPMTNTLTLTVLEAETQIWELPSLLAESSRYQREPAPGVMVEGWLFKKSSSRLSLQQWNKRWFMMDKEGIYYFRSSAEMKKANGYLHTLERVKICDIILCTVREFSNESLRFQFEIFTPNQKPLLLQARGPLEYKTWVDGIRNAIETQLMSGDRPSENLMQNIGKKKKKRGDGVPDHVPTLASMLEAETVPTKEGEQGSDDGTEVPPPQFRDSDGEEDFNAESDLLERSSNPLVESVLESNLICADCNAPNPDWASLNLGVLVCIECSGVHRSLGVHVSKMRSLKLDSLTKPEARLLLAMGNDRVNSIWEAGVGQQQGWTKPVQGDTRQLKDNWIKSKYQWKGFLDDRESSESETQEKRVLKYSRMLYEAAAKADVMGIAKCMAYGGKVDWKNSDDDDKTALHVCALSKPTEEGEWMGIESAELLIQNGAKANVMDINTQTALDCAVIGNGEREMVEFLSSRR